MSLLGTVFYIDDLVKHNGANNLNYPNVTEINDIVYDDSNEYCKLDLLFDENKLPESGLYPVVFNIHGGGWIVGDKRFRRGVCLQFANSGNFVININYALTPKYTYKDEVQNIFSALKWIQNNAKKYKLDLEDLGINFNGSVLFCGPYDFTEFWMRFPIMDAMLKGIAGIKSRRDYQKSEYVDYLNPIPSISSKFPKTLVVTGAQDFVTNPHNVKLMAKFDELGIEYERYHATHLFNSFHDFHLKIWMPEAKRAMKKACDFIKEVLA